MKTDEENRAITRNVISNVRACMKDHNITLGELATLTGRSPHKLRLQFINGSLSIAVCGVLYDRTGRQDMRAYGIDADYVPGHSLDEAIKLLARPDADQILAEAP